MDALFPQGRSADVAYAITSSCADHAALAFQVNFF